MGAHGSRRSAGPATGSHHALSAPSWRDRLPLVLAAVVGVVLLGAAFAGGLALGSGGTDDTAGGVPSRAAAASPDGTGGTAGAPDAVPAGASHPTMLAEVVRVNSGDEVVVRVDGRDLTVAVLGIDAPDTAGPGRSGQCGAAAALTFAEEQLAGETVTLVPDPTVPETDDTDRRLAYIVLRSQLSYTDAALLAGVVTADTSRNLWYGPVFEREQTEAAEAGRGMWGEPCGATPGEPLPTGA